MRNFVQKSMGLALVLLMNVFYAATFPLGKLGLQYAGAIFFTGLRMMLAGVVLLGYYLLTTKRMHTITRNDWLLMLKTVLFYDLLAFVFEFWAMQYMSSLKTNMLWSSLPFVSALLGYYFLHERLTKIKWMGLLVGTAGMVPMMLLPDERMAPLGDLFTVSLPELAMCIVVVSTAYGAFLVKKLHSRGYPLVLVNGITMLIGGSLLMTVRLSSIVWYPELYASLPHAIAYALSLVLVYDIAGCGIYGMLLGRYTLTFLSFSGLTCPIFGAIFSKLIFHETLYINYIIAFIMILIGLFLFYRDEISEELKQQ